MSERPYLDPQEAAQADAYQTMTELQVTVAALNVLYMQKAKLHEELRNADDEGAVEVIEWQLKLLREEERSLHRIESGLQSILKVP